MFSLPRWRGGTPTHPQLEFTYWAYLLHTCEPLPYFLSALHRFVVRTRTPRTIASFRVNAALGERTARDDHFLQWSHVWSQCPRPYAFPSCASPQPPYRRSFLHQLCQRYLGARNGSTKPFDSCQESPFFRHYP